MCRDLRLKEGERDREGGNDVVLDTLFFLVLVNRRSRPSERNGERERGGNGRGEGMV